MGDSGNFGKVLIVGAGLGGLALAQVLHTHGVPFEIFERDEAPASRKQGWAIALVESLKPLEELLPKEITDTFPTISVNHNTGEVDEFAFVRGQDGKVVAKLGGAKHGEDGYIIRANREGFRSLLWNANDLPVFAGKYFQRYEVDEKGVTAYFKDGSTARGSLLVGADGLHSHTLDQLIGQTKHVSVLSRWVPIFGEVTLPPEQYEPIRKLANSTLLVAAPGFRQQIGMLEMNKDYSTASFFWSVVICREPPEELSAWVQNASKQELYDFLMKDVCKDLHPVTKDLIAYGGVDSLVNDQPKFMEFVPPHELPSGRVTVLGDAAHSMIPFRGKGANVALLDACDLGRLLVRAHEKGTDPLDVVPEYLKVMIPRGQEAVISSRAAGDPETDDPEVHFKKFQREEAEGK